MLNNLDSKPVHFLSIGESDTDIFPPKYHLVRHALLSHKISQVLSRVFDNLYICKGNRSPFSTSALKRMACDDSSMICDLMLNRILLDLEAYIQVSYPSDEEVYESSRDWRFTVMGTKINPELLRLISYTIDINSANTRGVKPEESQPTLRGDSCVPLSKERWARYTGLSKHTAYVQVFNHLFELYDGEIDSDQTLNSQVEPMRFMTLIHVCIALRLDISIVDKDKNIHPIILNKTEKNVHA